VSKISIKKNFIYNTLYEILVIISPLITAPYVSRIFEADGVGVYSYTSAVASYFTMFAALGIKSYGQREIARHRDNPQQASKLFWELELLCISTTFLSLLIWCLVIIFSTEYTAYYAVLTVTVAATAFDISWFWKGQEQYKFIVIRNSAVKIIGIIILFVFVREKNDMLLYISLIAISGLIGNISMWANLSKYLVKIDRKTLSVKKHLSQTMVYFIPTVATSIYTVLDKVMLGWIVNSEIENGYYEQATKLINICKTLVLSINTVVSARLSFLFSKEMHDEIKEKMKAVVNFLLLIAIPVTLGLIGVASNFVPWFFGDGYEKTITVVYIMSPLLIIIGISNCLGSLYFVPSGQRARSNKAIIAGGLTNLFFNTFLIYLFQSSGAAIATVTAEIVITVMYLYMAKDYFNASCILKYSWKRLISAGFMLAVVIVLKSIIEEPLLLIIAQVGLGAAVYAVCLIALRDKLVTENLSKIFKSIFKRKGN